MKMPHSSRKLFSIRHIHRIRIPCVRWYHIVETSDGFETPLLLLRDVDLSIGYDLSPPPFE